ncbi:hypothetical protein BN1708_000352 [Verticillium longisporum]|uniref:Uncharacterized protein n=1 Tax=Verticillium longisporum TaxID=100787 RepID=A0A0G4KCN5_VERLO|nr:hypothetical protein BN1708_000352 [Verticillium longisporum]
MLLSPTRDEHDDLPSDGNGTCIQAHPKQPATAGTRRPTADGEGSRSLHRPRQAWPRSNVLRHTRASQRGTAPRKAAEPAAAQSRCVDASIGPPRCWAPGEHLRVLNGRADSVGIGRAPRAHGMLKLGSAIFSLEEQQRVPDWNCNCP